MWNEHYIFIVCAARGSFSAAAVELDMQPSSVSRAVTRLEEHLGVRLFERTARALVLTPSGHVLSEAIGPHMTAIAEASAEVRRSNARAEGGLRIAAPHEFITAWIEPVIERLQDEGFNLRFELLASAHLPDPVGAGVDIFFSHRREDVQDATLVCSRLHDVPQGLYASPALVTQLGAPAACAELSDWPCLVRPGETSWHFTDAEGGSVTVPVSAVIAATPSLLRLDFARRGRGAMIATRQVCDPLVTEGQLVELLPDCHPDPVSAWAFTPARRLPTRAQVLFLERVREALESDQFLA
ncbi:LysR family transcriptional regulator [Novosphingobium mangrovi (ex Hu et al. 2023)]|uniref:LysR family transcriptional regulator n=1 Tax=Novosphingobium mangrovi (ex Hu et al. 2023) TaxID=2930094 RepID=A0ABT0AIE8_9SPHN|nr:LysR family transcriptional regulator [Novosphingobium mangrovi (ex Hu et al. 2023)]MCJ1962960.1 LysR family transcriptional regulator [Novosphingobium mangrovi (ex Hu et al. 2023)]